MVKHSGHALNVWNMESLNEMERYHPLQHKDAITSLVVERGLNSNAEDCIKETCC